MAVFRDDGQDMLHGFYGVHVRHGQEEIVLPVGGILIEGAGPSVQGPCQGSGLDQIPEGSKGEEPVGEEVAAQLGHVLALSFGSGRGGPGLSGGQVLFQGIQELFEGRKGTAFLPGLPQGILDGGTEAGKARIQLLRIFDLGHHQDDAVGGKGDGLYHYGHVLHLEAELEGSLAHHVLKKAFGLVRTVCQLAEPDLTLFQIFAGQNAADLIVIDFLDLQVGATFP